MHLCRVIWRIIWRVKNDLDIFKIEKFFMSEYSECFKVSNVLRHRQRYETPNSKKITIELINQLSKDNSKALKYFVV